MPDIADLGPTASDQDALRHTLSLVEVEAALATAGVPRSHRHVQRMCLTGLLDARKLPGPSGDEWFVAPHSLPKAIGDLTALQARRERHAAPQRVTPGHDAPQLPLNLSPDRVGPSAPERAVSEAIAPLEPGQSGTRDARHSAPQHDMTDPIASKYVLQLERENEFLRGQVNTKDQQIADLSDRFSETQKLLAGVQRMLAPLLGQGDPYRTPDAGNPTPPAGE